MASLMNCVVKTNEFISFLQTICNKKKLNNRTS